MVKGIERSSTESQIENLNLNLRIGLAHVDRSKRGGGRQVERNPELMTREEEKKEKSRSSLSFRRGGAGEYRSAIFRYVIPRYFQF